MNFKDVRVNVYGDAMLDIYVHGAAYRLSPEAPVPVLFNPQVENRAGGAANVAMNIKALGGAPRLLGYVGADTFGTTLQQLMLAAGVDSDLPAIDNASTITKTRVLANNQQVIRIDAEHPWPRHALWMYKEAKAAVFSDYGKGTLNEFEFNPESYKISVVDTKATDWSRWSGATLLKPNVAEFTRAVCPWRRNDAAIGAARHYITELGIKHLLVTEGAAGMTYIPAHGVPVYFNATAHSVADVTGAGDTVAATVALALAAGYPMLDAIGAANTAAGVVVGKLGTATCTQEEIGKPLTVFANGCFDGLHAGHLHLLGTARGYGRLIVGLNSDKSVERLKGHPPKYDYGERNIALLATGLADAICMIEEDTPDKLIQSIKPDVLIVGEEYRGKDPAGVTFVEDFGGRVVYVPRLPGYSSTDLNRALQ